MQQELTFKKILSIATAGSVTAIICMKYHFKGGHWAVIATLLTMLSNSNSNCLINAIADSINRAVGTVLGVLIGLCGYYSMEYIVSDGYIWLIIIVVFFTLIITLTINKIFKNIRLITECAVMVMMMGLQQQANFIAYERSIEIIVGVSVAIIFNLFMWNKVNNDKNELKHITELCQAYFEHSLKQLITVTTTLKKPSQRKINEAINQIVTKHNNWLKKVFFRNAIEKNNLLKEKYESLTLSLFQINQIINKFEDHITENHLKEFEYATQQTKAFFNKIIENDISTRQEQTRDNVEDNKNKSKNLEQLILLRLIYDLNSALQEINNIMQGGN